MTVIEPKIVELNGQPKPIEVHAPAKTGSMVVWQMMQMIEKHSRWSTYRLPLMTGPVRNFQIKHDSLNYIVQLRNPLDHLVSKYYSEGWLHPYQGHPRRDKWEADRKKIQAMTVDEYCLHKLQEGRHFNQFTHLIKMGRDFGATFVTYEEMKLNFNEWNERFLRPFKISSGNRLKILNDMKGIMTRSIIILNRETGELFEHVRDGTPGEFNKVLEPMTIEILKDAYSDIISHIKSHMAVDPGFLDL